MCLKQSQCDRPIAECATCSYLDIVSSGGPRIDKHASAQNAYAPCASTPGLPEMPPSKVWPRNRQQR